MKGPNITVLKKYLNAMSKNKVKYMTCERLSRIVGVYPEIIAENLSYFDPLLTMDPSYDLLVLIPQMKEYIQQEEEKKTNVAHKVITTKRDVDEYESVSDFVYKKMTFAGMVDRNLSLNEKDLRILKRLVNDELANCKKKQLYLQKHYLMKKEYNFTKAKKNPYFNVSKKQVTLNINEEVLIYFKNMSEQTGIPYQNLINLYLLDCVNNKKTIKFE